MPHNGEKNIQSGSYRSLCCGTQIVINAASTFPDCPNHPRLSTTWKLVAADKTSQPPAKVSERQATTDSHIENRRLFDLVFGRVKLEEWENDHLHGCTICQGVLYVLVHQLSGGPSEMPGKKNDAA
jgi:hypothetical protein